MAAEDMLHPYWTTSVFSSTVTNDERSIAPTEFCWAFPRVLPL
jgi:hypothetical protein